MEPDKCDNCDCELTENNCTYEDGICDDCYEDEHFDDEDSDDEE